MAGQSTYLKNAMLNHVLGGGDYTRPVTAYLALYTVTPTATGGGSEVTGAGYARAAVPNTTAYWPAAVSGLKYNGTAIPFPTAAASWGTVVGLGVHDAITAGNLLYYGDLAVARAIASGAPVSFASGALLVSGI